MGHPDRWREKKCFPWERYGYFLELHNYCDLVDCEWNVKDKAENHPCILYINSSSLPPHAPSEIPEPTSNSSWKLFPALSFYHLRNNLNCKTTGHLPARYRILIFNINFVCLQKVSKKKPNLSNEKYGSPS